MTDASTRHPTDAELPAAHDPRDGSDGPLAELETIMTDLLVCYEQLHTLALRRLEAVRGADARGLGDCVRAENEIVQQVAEIEKRRIAVVGRLAAELGSPRKSQTTVSWIAERAAGPGADRLRDLAAALRDVIGRVRRHNEVAAQAARALATHMDGLIRRVAQHLNHAQVYSRVGSVDAGPRVTSSLDISS